MENLWLKHNFIQKCFEFFSQKVAIVSEDFIVIGS